MRVDNADCDDIATHFEVVGNVVLLHLTRRFSAPHSDAIDQQVVLVVGNTAELDGYGLIDTHRAFGADHAVEKVAITTGLVQAVPGKMIGPGCRDGGGFSAVIGEVGEEI